MNILLINGSPKGKRSNSLKLANSFIEGFKEGYKSKNEDISIDEMHVASMNIGACKGCFACWQKTPGVCCINDDMQTVIGKMLEADIVVWSFPLYYFSVPGILKNVIDRQLPMSLPFMSTKDDGYGSGSHDCRYDMEGKRHVLISTCGFYSAREIMTVYFGCLTISWEKGIIQLFFADRENCFVLRSCQKGQTNIWPR